MDSKEYLIISQARMTSSRLPGKVLRLINGRTLLDYHLSRLSEFCENIVCATTNLETDDTLCNELNKLKIKFFRGSETDVLSRYYHCAKEFNAKFIVRVTSDCPLIDGELIRNSLTEHINNNNSNLYTSNVIKRTYPRGLDFEIFSFDMLKDAYLNAHSSSDREHVTPYIRNQIPSKFSSHDIVSTKDNSHIRITVDEESDFKLIKLLIEKYNCHLLSFNQIINIIESNSSLLEINKHINQKATF